MALRKNFFFGIVFSLAVIWLLVSGLTPANSQDAGLTQTITITPTRTITPTPTSMPGPPILLAPEAGAVLPQPISPTEWVFTWDARQGPCYTTIGIYGPGDRHISATVFPPYEYHYTGEVIPDDALSPWYWIVGVQCPLGSNNSESRTFSVLSINVTPTPLPVYLPMIHNNP